MSNNSERGADPKIECGGLYMDTRNQERNSVYLVLGAFHSSSQAEAEDKLAAIHGGFPFRCAQLYRWGEWDPHGAYLEFGSGGPIRLYPDELSEMDLIGNIWGYIRELESERSEVGEGVPPEPSHP